MPNKNKTMLTSLRALLLSCTFIAVSNTASAGLDVVHGSDVHSVVKHQDRFATNIGILQVPAGLVLVDPMPDEANFETLATMVSDRSNNRKLFVFNTHSHADHTGGNFIYLEKGAVLVSETQPGIDVYRVDSHSWDDRFLFHKQSNTLFVGDVIDTSWHPTFYSGGWQGFAAATDLILSLADEQTVIVPGHGDVLTRAELSAYRQRLQKVIDRIATLIEQGTDVKMIVKDEQFNTLLAGFNYAGFQPFLPDKAKQRFVERVTDTLQASK